jgi:outer membrane protein TolC
MKLIFVVLISTLLSPLWSQPLPELLDSLAQQNPELRALTTEYQAARQRAPQVSQLPNPEVGLGLFPRAVETRLGAQRARLSGTQMFPWFGTLDAKSRLADTRAAVVQEQVAARHLELAFELKQAYFRLYEVRQRRGIIQRKLDILAALEQVSLARVRSGQATTADVLRIQIQREELAQELAILATTALPYRATINQLLDRPAATPVPVADTLAFAEWPYTRSRLLPAVAADHPRIRQFARQQEAARQALAVNELAGQPAFSLGFDYILVDQRTDAFPPGNGRDILQLRAGVQLPLYRKQYAAKAQEEQLRIAAWEDRKAALRNQFTTTVEAAFARYERARLRHELYVRQIELTQSARDILAAEYQATGQRFDELLRLERELIDYDLKRLTATVESHLARIDIEQLIEQ